MKIRSFVFVLICLALLLVGCNSDDMQWFETKEKAIEFGLKQELTNEEAILSIQDVSGETIVIFEKSNAIGAASIAESKKGFGWYRSSPYIDLSQISTDSIYKTILDVKTKSDTYIPVVIGKVSDLVENVVIQGDGEKKVVEITNNGRYFCYIPSVPIEELIFSPIKITPYSVEVFPKLPITHVAGNHIAIGQELFVMYLESKKSEATPEEYRVKDYKIHESDMWAEGDWGFEITVNYSIQGYETHSYAAGNGVVAEDGWVNYKFQFIKVVKDQEYFSISEINTSPSSSK